MVMVSGEWLAHGDKLVLCMKSQADLGLKDNLQDESSVDDNESTQLMEPIDNDNIPTPTKLREVIDRKEITIMTENDNDDATQTTIASMENSTNAHDYRNNVNSKDNNNYQEIGDEPINLLVEIVGASLPKQLVSGGVVKWEDSRGVHCTVHWVGPRLPSGRKRQEELVHRTKSLPVGGGGGRTTTDVKRVEASSTSSGLPEEEDEDELHDDHIFTVNDGSLFVFDTTLKKLVNASSSTISSSQADFRQSGGLRFDVFLKPLDTLSAVSSYIAASTVSEKENNAITASDSSFSSSMMASYRLLGSVFLTPEEILSRCDEERFEMDLDGELRKLQHSPAFRFGGSSAGDDIDISLGQLGTKSVSRGNGGRLALRMRVASKCDIAFLKSLADTNTSNDAAANYSLLQSSLSQDGSNQTSSNNDINPVQTMQLLTEIDENVMTANSSIKSLTNMAPVAQESVRYLFSNDEQPRVLVKPYPDPDRVQETTFLTEAELREECYKQSRNWIQAGSGSLGKVYLEVLQCQGLPNVDAGESFGNKTDAFVSVVYGDVMVQTDVIDDSLAPMWMPWHRRAFVMNMSHPSTAIYIAVTDYDVGPLEHENIGRIAINVGTSFTPGLIYTLTYRLNESSNYTEFGEDKLGTITIRLRVEYDEKSMLQVGLMEPDRNWVSATQYKSHRIAKYCVDGPHDSDVFEMRLFRSHINEILTQKSNVTRLVKDAIYSLVFWKGQVHGLPVHSAVAFCVGVNVVENPRLIPSLFFFVCGWIMVSNMFHRQDHPNPWQRGISFAEYWSVLLNGRSHRTPQEIRPFENNKETIKYNKIYSDRLEEENKQYEQQLELNQKLADISNDTIIRTKAKAKTALVDPLSAVAGARLLPYQQRLAGICCTIRYYRNILNWKESVLSFWVTLALFGLAMLSLIVPWGFILLWASRVVVWVFLGPWMKLVDIFLHGVTIEEESERAREKTLQKLMKSFREQKKVAKVLRENALKLKAFRVKLFGEYITRLPEYNLTRHEDIPLPESKAELYRGEQDVSIKMVVPGQNLRGHLIPKLGQHQQLKKNGRIEIEREELISQYHRVSELRQNGQKQSLDENPDEGFELISGHCDHTCLLSSVPSVHDPSDVNATDDESDAGSSVRDVIISENTIRAALWDPLSSDSFVRRKSRWSCSLSLSITKEELPNPPMLATGDKTALSNRSARHMRHIHQNDDTAVEEEGIEIVPSSNNCAAGIHSGSTKSLDNSEHVSVLYVESERSINPTHHHVKVD